MNEKSVEDAFWRVEKGDGRRVRGADLETGEGFRVDERRDLVDRLLTERVILEGYKDNKSGGSESSESEARSSCG